MNTNSKTTRCGIPPEVLATHRMKNRISNKIPGGRNGLSLDVSPLEAGTYKINKKTSLSIYISSFFSLCARVRARARQIGFLRGFFLV